MRVGSTLKELQALKLVGGARKGCELSPGQRVAPLKPPLEGFAVFYPANRVSSVDLTGGAPKTLRASGSEPASARPVRPTRPPPTTRRRRGRRSRSGFIWIGGRNHPKMTLVIDPDTHKVSEISVPFPNICE